MFPDITRDDVFRLETSRLWLRWPRAGDAAPLARIAGRREVAEMTARIPHPYPPGEADAFVMRAREQNCHGQGLTLAITLNGGDRAVIGTVMIAPPAEGAADDAPSLGYYVDPARWGRGYASEAAQAMVDLAFMVTPEEAIAATVRVENPASSRVLEKIGFAWHGAAITDQPARGRPLPVDRFRLTRAAWAA